MSEVAEARRALHAEVQERFLDDIQGTDTEEKLFVALVLHPCFNHVEFTSTDNVSDEKKAWALQATRDRWELDFKPLPRPNPPPVTDDDDGPQLVKRPRVSSVFGLMRMAPPRAATAVAAPPASLGPAVPVLDELDQYLAQPQEPNADGFSLLLWWKAKEHVYPALAKMAKHMTEHPFHANDKVRQANNI